MQSQTVNNRPKRTKLPSSFNSIFVANFKFQTLVFKETQHEKNIIKISLKKVTHDDYEKTIFYL